MFFIVLENVFFTATLVSEGASSFCNNCAKWLSILYKNWHIKYSIHANCWKSANWIQCSFFSDILSQSSMLKASWTIIFQHLRFQPTQSRVAMTDTHIKLRLSCTSWTTHDWVHAPASSSPEWPALAILLYFSALLITFHKCWKKVTFLYFMLFLYLQVNKLGWFKTKHTIFIIQQHNQHPI